MPDYTFVDKPDQIRSWLEAHSLVAVDTEFMRERSFFSQLCLVQIASTHDIYCVDPLGGDDMSAFWQAFCEQTWVLHSARQDIEVVFQTAQRMPKSIFDTQIAAGLLGYQPQMGYGNLVEALFDIELPKSHTRANWATRPLPDKYLDYAAEDVEYLLPAYELLAERLDRKGRLAWAESDSSLLLDPSLYDVDPATAISRLKGAARFSGKRRAVATRLAQWREQEALRRNLPRQWIMRDNALIELACCAPATLAELSQMENVPANVVKWAGNSIIAAISEAAGDSNDYQPPAAPTPEQKTLLKRMQKIVADCAEGLEVAAETIASRKELSAVILGGSRDSRVFSGWRRDLIGERLIELL